MFQVHHREGGGDNLSVDSDHSFAVRNDTK